MIYVAYVLLLCRDSLMFWSDIKNDVIYRADLDGMQEEILVDSNIDVVGEYISIYLDSRSLNNSIYIFTNR